MKSCLWYTNTVTLGGWWLVGRGTKSVIRGLELLAPPSVPPGGERNQRLSLITSGQGFNQLRLPNGASIKKPLTMGFSGEDNGVPGEQRAWTACKLHTPSCIPCPMYGFHLPFLSYVPYNKLLTINKALRFVT